MRRRREFLLAAGGAVTALSGCLGETPAGGTNPAGDGSQTSEPAATGDAPIQLQSVDVGPSPGGTVPVRSGGTPSLVDFFATWCAPCEPQMEGLNAIRAAYGPEELHLTSVTSETDEAAIEGFWTENDGSWPVLMDPDLDATQQYGVRGVPTLVLLDGAGETLWRHQGLAGEDTLREEVADAVDS